MEEYKNLEIKDEEKEKLLDDHDFDGIRELDNPPPPWLVYLFYASIIFAGIYFFSYHVFKSAPLQNDKFEQEMATFNTEKTTEHINLKFLSDEVNLQAGAAIFQSKACFSCHGLNLEGNAIGPNLTDEYWISGNTIEDLMNIITNGKIEKGMTPFKDQLTTEQMLQVASYIWSKQGSNPSNAKAPQGEKY
ncbi:cbb3-type cytochrome c oxidase N-terminal domain-containing protein [Bacteroidota bacterium]